MPLSSGTQLGPYEILAPLGAGGMGEVYRARDTKLKRDVAVKVLPEAFASDTGRMARFQREAEVLASLSHPNIAHIYGVEDKALVMELVEGESPQGPMPFEDAWKIALQMADALEYAHDKGVIHRDLKPANVKVTPEGVVKLLDFGLAKAFSDTPEAASGDPVNSPTLTMNATLAGVILGTAAYMAPEQAKGKRVDKRADIWSWGVVLYELLTGERLFQSDEAADTLAQVLTKQPNLEKAPPQVRKLLRRCLERDPKQRLRDIGEARYLLEETTGGEAAAHSRRSSLGWTAAAAFALIAATLGFVHFRETPPSPPQGLRYTIGAPENSIERGFDVSPDGRYLVIAALTNSKSSNPQLWLRPLDSLQARPLPTTEGARDPFWSPDSRYIGFFAQGKLRKIAVSGGPSEPICDVSINLRMHGTWSRDGVILFSEAVRPGIKRVSAEGGAPVEVTGGKGAFPAFLPDGRHFLYSQTLQENGVYLASLDGKENRRVLAESLQGSAFFVPESHGRTGYILLQRASSLMAQPFDLGSLQTSGDLFPVAENVSALAVAASANGTLIYRSGATVGGGNTLVWYDRAGKSTPVGPRGGVWEPAISPDERSIAYSRDSGGAYSDVWLLDLAHGGAERRLTTDASQNNTPVWSPQGDRILFRSMRAGRQELYQRPASAAGKDELLPTTPDPKFASQWAQNGVILLTNNVGTGLDLLYLPANQGNPKAVMFLHTGFREGQGQLSPDGRWIAFSSDRSGQREVYVRPFPTGDGEWRISITGGEQPRWSGDGRELFFVGADGKMMAAAVKPAPGPKPAFDWSAPVPLFDTHMAQAPLTSAFQYDVTKDGKRFLVATSGTVAEAAAPLTVWVNWTVGLKK